MPADPTFIVDRRSSIVVGAWNLFWVQLISLDEDDAEGATTARPIPTCFLRFLYATGRAGFGKGHRHRPMSGRNCMPSNKNIYLFSIPR